MMGPTKVIFFACVALTLLYDASENIAKVALLIFIALAYEVIRPKLRQLYQRFFVSLDLIFYAILLLLLSRLWLFLIPIIAGGCLNCLVIWRNKSLLPVCPEKMKKMLDYLPAYDSSGVAGFPGYCYVCKETKLKFLGDILYINNGGVIFSLGDILMFIGFIIYPAYCVFLCIK